MKTTVRALAKRILRRGNQPDYREALFAELRAYLGGTRPVRVLEIGPKNGYDTRRLLGRDPQTLTLIDLPRMLPTNEQWLQKLDRSRIGYISANFMYSEEVHIYPPSEAVKRKDHLSLNITHLPSSRAIASWLAMTGFKDVSPVHFRRSVSASLARARAAFLARKPSSPKVGTYYAVHGAARFEIGGSR